MGRTTTQVNLRLKPELRERLQAAANAAGKTMTQEMTERLLFSFDDEQRLDPVFSDRTLYALVTAGAIAMRNAGVQSYLAANSRIGSPQPFEAAEHWIDDPYAFSEATIAAMQVLSAAAPAEPVSRRANLPEFGRLAADSVLTDIVSEVATFGEPPERAERLRRYLGKLVDRLRSKRHAENQKFLGSLK